MQLKRQDPIHEVCYCSSYVYFLSNSTLYWLCIYYLMASDSFDIYSLNWKLRFEKKKCKHWLIWFGFSIKDSGFNKSEFNKWYWIQCLKAKHQQLSWHYKTICPLSQALLSLSLNSPICSIIRKNFWACWNFHSLVP